MWPIILLCLKFLGIIFVLNLLLAMFVMAPVLVKLNLEIHFKRLFLIKKMIVSLFWIVNGLAFCYLLKMSLNTFETEYLNRKQLFVVLIILLLANSLINYIAREYKKSIAEKDYLSIDSWSKVEQKIYFSNIALYEALTYALGLGFWIWLVLITKPTWLGYFLIF
jgi:hypothetical protein